MRFSACFCWLLLAISTTVAAEDQDLAGRLARLNLRILDNDYPATRARLALEKRIRDANQDSSAAWSKIHSRAEWEAFKAAKLSALRDSLRLPESRPPVKLHIAGEIAGERYKVQKVIYETRPRWFVTANLYLPVAATDPMPGILLSHSHHSPKSQSELQDMGATWSRAGCAVLVPDHLGHGERRTHPFAQAADYDKEFPVSRQDYHFRYDESLQLYLAGESLMGWMVHDLLEGVDVLLSLGGIDKQKIILFGGVAGGGDPAAVAGAMDDRIACVGPFNFGGPQPETTYPLPADAEVSFGYAGSGSWESTRNLADSARDGFLPWVIVGSIAPRRLIYGHEFSWDRDRDPVFRRLETIWRWYDDADNLGFAHGRGTLRGNRPEDTHCGNIGAFHRRMMHPLLSRWFKIAVREEDEYSAPRTAAELACWTAALRQELKPLPLHEILLAQAARAQPKRDVVTDDRRLRERLRVAWSERLALGADQDTPPMPKRLDSAGIDWPGVEVLQFAMNHHGAAKLVWLPPLKRRERDPVVLLVAHGGSKALLEQRSREVAELLQNGIAVALVDVRHAGVFADGRERGQNSALTAHSATYLMFGQPLLGAQLQDLQAVLGYLRGRTDVDAARLAIWGESLSRPLAAGASCAYPRRVERPSESDPLGAHLAILAALFDDDLHLVVARGGLTSYSDVLESPFVQMPHSVVVRDLFTAGDLPLICAALPDKKLLRTQSVDGCNRLAPAGNEPAPAKWLAERLAH